MTMCGLHYGSMTHVLLKTASLCSAHSLEIQSVGAECMDISVSLKLCQVSSN